MITLKEEKQKEAKLLTMRGVKCANLVNECFNYFIRSKQIFLYLDFCLFSDKTNEIAFHRGVNAKSLAGASAFSLSQYFVSTPKK